MKILVTGAAGYIGSHTCVELLQAGHQVLAFDNFSNSHPEALRRVEQITSRKFIVMQGDIRDQTAVESAFKQHGCQAVMHFAGLKSVKESITHPEAYQDNNIRGTQTLLAAMQRCDVNTLVFSSSATVYGQPQILPFTEDHPLVPGHPYGASKLAAENMLRDLYLKQPIWRIAILRYFNPAGAHSSGLIGETPKGAATHLMPLIGHVASGQRELLSIWGSDYSTHDGTGVRDYIHVTDLAVGHLKALKQLSKPQCFTINLGTGRGYSVLDVVKVYEAISGKRVPYQLLPRRSGDLAAYYANPALAENLLQWKASRNLSDMCRDHWHWLCRNPQGYSASLVHPITTLA